MASAKRTGNSISSPGHDFNSPAISIKKFTRAVCTAKGLRSNPQTVEQILSRVFLLSQPQSFASDIFCRIKDIRNAPEPQVGSKAFLSNHEFCFALVNVKSTNQSGV